jgi:hypothetical protein
LFHHRFAAYAATAAMGLTLAAIAGCSVSGPGEQELRAALVEQIHKDDTEYNQRVDRWAPPKPEIDGSSFSMTRMHRKLAVSPAQLEIRKTGGHTTVYEAEVPRIIQTWIKTGLSEEECLAAPERRLEPQRVVTKYEYDVVRRQWHEAMLGGPGGLLGP